MVVRLTFALGLVLAVSRGALAQPSAASTTPTPSPQGTEAAPVEAAGSEDQELGGSELGRSGLLSDEQVLYEERYGYAARPERHSPHEQEDQSYWSMGGSYRHSFAPAGVIELFVEQAPRGIDVPQFSFEVDRRRNGVDLIFGLRYADFSFVGPFRSNGDGIEETEIIESSLRTISADVSMLWSSNFGDVVALQYGFDFGLGLLFGDLFRTEAYPSQGGPNSHAGWAPCVGPAAPGMGGSAQPSDPFDPSRYSAPNDTLGAYCGPPNDTNPAGGYTDVDGQSGEHYQIRARSMLDGGKVPFFSWRLAPRISLRIKPIRQLIMRLDAGFDLGSGVFLGAGLHYGF